MARITSLGYLRSSMHRVEGAPRAASPRDDASDVVMYERLRGSYGNGKEHGHDCVVLGFTLCGFNGPDIFRMKKSCLENETLNEVMDKDMWEIFTC